MVIHKNSQKNTIHVMMKHVDKKNIDDHILHDCKSKTMIEISERLNQGVSSIDQSIDLTSLITKETPLPKGPMHTLELVHTF